MSTANRALSFAIGATIFSLLLFGCAGTVATSESLGQAQDTSIGPVLVAWVKHKTRPSAQSSWLPMAGRFTLTIRTTKASRIAQACVPQHGHRCSRPTVLVRRTASL